MRKSGECPHTLTRFGHVETAMGPADSLLNLTKVAIRRMWHLISGKKKWVRARERDGEWRKKQGTAEERDGERGIEKEGEHEKQRVRGIDMKKNKMIHIGREMKRDRDPYRKSERERE